MRYLDWKAGDRIAFQGIGSVTLIHVGWRKYIPGLRKTRLTHNLVPGEIYEIDSLTTHTEFVLRHPVVVVYLKGFRFLEHGGVGFPAQWFRKVQTRKTDISTFTAMLRGTRQKVGA